MTGELVLGLGGTVDYEVRWDAGVLQSLADEYGIRRSELDVDTPIVDERALLVTVLAFIDRDAGGERFVASSGIVEAFAARLPTEVTLGGTGVRAGIALASLGIATTQHLVSIDDTVRRLLPPDTRVLSSATGDTLDPHLIVQYPGGASVTLPDGVVTARDANRLIFADDPPNRSMALAGELPEALAGASALLVSGFNTMQNERLLARRLDELVDAMRSLPDDALVYYEDAGFYEPSFSMLARQALEHRIDVYGMNEDELQGHLDRAVDLLDPVQVSAALNDLHERIPVGALVVHTRYWAIAVGADAGAHRVALRSAVDMAATRYRLGDGHTAADFAATAELPEHPEGRALVDAIERAGIGTGVAARSMAVTSPTTIGLGDTFVGGFLAGAVESPRRVDGSEGIR